MLSKHFSQIKVEIVANVAYIFIFLFLDVKERRAQDKLISMFNEQRQAEIDRQRKSLSLAKLFAKPRPVWEAVTVVGCFGDAFIEKTGFEGSSVLAWSYTVMNLY